MGKFGGLIAGVGRRMMGRLAKMMVDQLFKSNYIDHGISDSVVAQREEMPLFPLWNEMESFVNKTLTFPSRENKPKA
ncbi:MAG: hypothetical protein O7C72_00815 [Deltaproteobacteria bacterium]|nr:hypothetical protein [Deltaproteobacteria bacterium]